MGADTVARYAEESDQEAINGDDEEYIFRSKLPDIPLSDRLLLHDYCFEKLPQVKDNVSLINGATGETFSFSQVMRTSRMVANGLNAVGIQKGDVIMLLLQNSPEFAFAFLGASFRGAICTMANPYFTAAEIAKQAEACNVKLIITQSSFVDKVKQFASENDVKLVTTDSSFEGCLQFSELITADDNDFPDVVIDPDDVVALPFSSGTTGLPKGVMLSHRNLVSGAVGLVDGENPNISYNEKDVILCVLPLFHIYALHSILLCALRVGAAIVIMPKFDIVSLLELVQKYKVTAAPCVPPMFHSISKFPEVKNYDLQSIRIFKCGAAPLANELQLSIKNLFPNAIITQGYGMTEGGPVSMSLALAKEPFPAKSGACGTVVRNAELKIVDPVTGRSLPRYQQGEICIRGSQVMKGYLNDPEATKTTIDERGWLHTGDIGYVDDDEELFIVDRLKELIKYKGFQIAPAELEAILTANPDISEAAVVPMEDEVAGEIPVAFIVRSNGSAISEDDVIEYVSKQVVFYKRIKKVFFTDSIPKSSSGKILRKNLKVIVASFIAAK